MLNWFEGDVHTNGVRLHYYRSGGDKPPLVMVHGFTDNALYWTRAAQALAPEWDVILYDARGHGTSNRAGGHFGDAERVSDLVGLVEALKLHRPGLMGHSMGGATIALVAAQHPQLPRFVILEDPAWFEPPPDESAEQAAQRVATRSSEIAAWREWVRGLQNGTREFGLSQIRAHSPNWSEIDQDLSLNARLQVELTVFDSYPQQHSPWRNLVSQIQCPILLLIGDNPERSAIITPEQAQEAATLWREGRWVQIRSAGHSIRYDQFEQYIDAVKTFLREVH